MALPPGLYTISLRFLAHEGVIDKDRFTAYLQTAMEEMSPGIDDQRTLFGLRQIIQALRTPPAPKDVQ